MATKSDRTSCTYNDCRLPIKTKKSGYCNAHYLRMLRGKDMDAPVTPPYRTDADRFWSKVDKTPDCWIWTGANMPASINDVRKES